MKHTIYYTLPDNPVVTGRIIDQLAPLFKAYWDEMRDSNPLMGDEFKFNVVGLMTQMRLSNMLLVLFTTDNGEPAGFAIGAKLQSLFTAQTDINWVHLFISPAHRKTSPIEFIHRVVVPQVRAKWKLTEVYTTTLPRLEKIHERYGAVKVATIMRYPE